MQLVPLRLVLLFHDVVPSVNGVLIIVRQDIEGSAGQGQKLCALTFLYDGLDRILAQRSGRPFVGFVNNHAVPYSIENNIILFKFSTDLCGAAEVLNGSKIDKLFTRGK